MNKGRSVMRREAERLSNNSPKVDSWNEELISKQVAIDAIYDHEFSNWCDKDEVSTVLNDLPPAQQWIPVMDGDGEMPPVDKEGYSDYILVSFSNFTGLAIGQYRVDEQGGAFYHGDDDDPFTKIGVFVNAWMPLPKPYREEE